MSVELLRCYIREAVLDASQRFKNRRTQAFASKVKSLADDMPGVFSRQADQEKQVNDALEAVTQIPDEQVSQKRARMAVPAAFSDNEFWAQCNVVQHHRIL